MIFQHLSTSFWISERKKRKHCFFGWTWNEEVECLAGFQQLLNFNSFSLLPPKKLYIYRLSYALYLTLSHFTAMVFQIFFVLTTARNIFVKSVFLFDFFPEKMFVTRVVYFWESVYDIKKTNFLLCFALNSLWAILHDGSLNSSKSEKILLFLPVKNEGHSSYEHAKIYLMVFLFWVIAFVHLLTIKHF